LRISTNINDTADNKEVAVKLQQGQNINKIHKLSLFTKFNVMNKADDLSKDS
jgi:hypothetical protein